MQIIYQTARLFHRKYRRPGRLDQGLQLRRLHRIPGRIPRDNHRTLSIGQKRRCLLYQVWIAVGPAHGTILLRQVGRQVLLADWSLLQVDGQCEVNRTRPAAHGRAERRRHELRYAVFIMYQPGTLSYRSRHRDLVNFLEGRLTLFRQFGAAGHEYHRALRRVDRRQPGNRIRKSRARR